MWQLHTKTPEHWVPISAVASFKRMRQYSSGENGVQWVADVLKSSEYLEVDEGGENVRRRTEVQEPKGQFERSVYAVCTPHFSLPGRISNPSFCRKVSGQTRARIYNYV